VNAAKVTGLTVNSPLLHSSNYRVQCCRGHWESGAWEVGEGYFERACKSAARRRVDTSGEDTNVGPQMRRITRI
jgi:hypothetical protein